MPQVLLHRGVMEKLLTMDWTIWGCIIRILQCSAKKKCVVWLQPGFGKKNYFRKETLIKGTLSLLLWLSGILLSWNNFQSWELSRLNMNNNNNCTLQTCQAQYNMTVLLPYPQKHWILRSSSLKLLFPFYSVTVPLTLTEFILSNARWFNSSDWGTLREWNV